MCLSKATRGSNTTWIVPLLAGLVIALALTGSVAGGTARAAPRDKGQPGADQALLVIGNTVRGTVRLPPDQLPFLACTIQSRFPQGGEIVFRMKVIDPDTGQAMDDTQVTSLTLTLADGTTQAFAYGGHPPGPGGPTDYFWSTAWTIPMDYPTGALDFQVTAVDVSGRTGSYQQFNVAPSLVQIVPADQR